MSINLTPTGDGTYDAFLNEKMYHLVNKDKQPITNLTPKDFLKSERKEQEKEGYKINEINWLDEDFYDNWDKVKGHLKNLLGHGETLEEGDTWQTDFYFLAHCKDVIKGKPQLIENVQKRIPLIREVIKILKTKKDEVAEQIIKYYMFDEKYDKRYDGYQKDAFALDFWIYRIIQENGKDYYILADKKLPNEVCALKGMIVEVDDFAEFSRSMKIKSLSRLFFLKDFEPTIKIISKEQMVQYTKNKELNEESWLSCLGYNNQFNNFNRFPNDIELLRSAFILSGKIEGYPMHLFIMGTAGTKKSDGHIETLSQKFSEDPQICEGGNSRIKVLSPSFKEKPCSIGYLAKCNRIGFIDEIGKMVEFELLKHQMVQNNILGDLNFLLEHKMRMVGSGNDNEANVQATSKFLFVTNPMSGKPTIYNHVGIIDPTTLSRMLCWVQDEEEQEFVLGQNGIESLPSLPPNPPHTIASIYSNLSNIENRKKYVLLKKCWGEYSILDSIEREDFLTLFDSANSFICDTDNQEIERINSNITLLAREPMKSSVWKPRGRHHIKLLVDGLVKHRCMFKDYDQSFTAKKEDYDLAERILVRMVKSWDTDLSPRDEVAQ